MDVIDHFKRQTVDLFDYYSHKVMNLQGPFHLVWDKKTKQNGNNIVFGVVCVHDVSVEEARGKSQNICVERPSQPLKGVRNLIRI